MHNTKTNRHIARQPHIEPYKFIPLWQVWQENKKMQQDRLLWAYANESDSAIDYLQKEITRLNNNLKIFFN
jgi:hypothetical protein